MEQFSKQKSLEIARGLFLVKYEAAENPTDAPRFLVTVDPGSAGSVELILPPESSEAILWSPGACVVARATEPGRVRVAVAPARPDGSTAGRIQLIGLSNDPAGVRTEDAGPAATLDLTSFRLVGHVAGLGDVLADSDTWIAGPAAPSRIEGIGIQWPNKPADLSLRYAVTIGGPRPAMGQFVQAGSYAGTRGRALPVVGATIEISGREAAGWRLVAEAIFLGSAQMKVEGQRVTLAGPTGREPMVGLRVRIEPSDRPQSRQTIDREESTQNPKGDIVKPAEQTEKVVGKSQKLDIATPGRGRQTSKVRVFRSTTRNKESPSARDQ